MNYIYPAIFYPETDEKYSVIFPDLNNLATYGEILPMPLSWLGKHANNTCSPLCKTVMCFLFLLRLMQ